MKPENVVHIASQFATHGKPISANRFGSGHINDTYRVDTDGSDQEAYLLQRINTFIFKDVPKLMENMSLVCRHIRKKFQDAGEKRPETRSVTIVPTTDGRSFFQSETGEFWRMFILLEDTWSYDTLETADQAYAGGVAFGQFQKQLSDLPAENLHVILPRFHDISYRMDNLRSAIVCNKGKRADESEVRVLLEQIFSREVEIRAGFEKQIAKATPKRIIHNDTKFNNVLLNAAGEVQCVIDLDTVMPGYVAYDFGDAIRTIINNGAEDDPYLDRITLNFPLFEAYTEGYLSQAKEFLTDAEVESLLFGVRLIPFLQVVRFITDYIDGDVYYRVHYPDHNLVRAKAQLKLLIELESNEEKLEKILNKALIS